MSDERPAPWKAGVKEYAVAIILIVAVFYFAGFFDRKTRKTNVNPAQIEFALRKLALDSLQFQYLPAEEMRVLEIWINADQSCLSGRVTSTRGEQRFFSRGAALVTVESPVALNFEADWAACRKPEPLKAI